jgi:hypothetical protein
MVLHRLQAIRIGVADPSAQAGFYGEMGLVTSDGSLFDSPDGGTQIHVSEAPFRRLFGVDLGVDNESDLDDIATRLTTLGASTDAAPVSSRPRVHRAVWGTSWWPPRRGARLGRIFWTGWASR